MANLVPLRHSLFTVLRNWAMYNKHIYRTGVDISKMFNCNDDLLIEINLDVLPETYQQKFILKNVNMYIDGFLKSIERNIFMTIVHECPTPFTFNFIFFLRGQTYTRQVSYYFMTKIFH